MNKRGAYTLCSFDVFDTVVTRCFARPQDLFLAMQDRLIREGGVAVCGDGQFASQRIVAENEARLASDNEDTTLDAIYRRLAVRLAVDRERLDPVYELEIQLETESVRAVPEVLEKLRAHRRDGSRIVFLSDMYLPGEVLVNMLKRVGAWEEGDKLYVSGEVGLSKRTGNLYEYMLKQENVSPGEILHIGNDALHEIPMAKKHGIETVHIYRTELNRHERMYVELAEPSQSLPASCCAAATRITRLHAPLEKEHERTVWQTGATVAGPTVYAFAEWVLEQALARGFKRLYFEAREGQIVFNVASTIARARGLDIKLRYLEGSRYAWYTAALADVDEKAIEWLAPAIPSLSLRMIASRAHVDVTWLAEKAQRHGLSGKGVDEAITPDERGKVIKLLADDDVHLEIQRQASASSERVRAYFEQEGLFDDVSYALVDTGWSGRTQFILEGLFAKWGHRRALHGLYFFLGKWEQNCEGSLAAYFYDVRYPSGRGRLAEAIVPLIEILMGADHGCVLDYDVGAEKVRPIYSKEPSQLLNDWGIGLQQRAINMFAETLVGQLPDGAHVHQALWLSLRAVLESFYRDPYENEARAYGSLFFSEDHSTPTGYQMVDPYGWGTALNFGLFGKLPAKPFYADWRYGSLRLSPPKVRRAIQLIAQWRDVDIGKLDGSDDE